MQAISTVFDPNMAAVKTTNRAKYVKQNNLQNKT